eukprot:1315798-Prymnesium_polylepis.1
MQLQCLHNKTVDQKCEKVLSEKRMMHRTIVQVQSDLGMCSAGEERTLQALEDAILRTAERPRVCAELLNDFPPQPRGVEFGVHIR